MTILQRTPRESSPRCSCRRRKRRLEGTGLVAMILISVAAGFLKPAFQHRSPTLTRSSLAATCQRNAVDRQRVAMAMIAAKGTTITRTSDHVLVIYANDDEVTSHDEAVKRDDEMEEEEESLQDKDEELLRLRRAAVAAALLKSGANVPAAGEKPTSVGSRRLGSASKARNGASKTSQVVAGLRLVASISSVPKPSTNSTSSKANSPKVHLESAKIKATIDNLLSKQQVPEPNINSNVDFFKTPRRMGVLGEPVEAIPHRLLQYPMPGTILVHPTSSLAVGGITRDTITVRVATMADDADVANLRLSVFSDFSLEVRKQFCARSIQALSNRRLRGATSLVASIPAVGKKKDGRTDVVLGSVEASIHEFFGTDLGKRTKEDSILYITEVAVTPSARRCGIGSKLLEGIDELAKLRNVDTLYLHVDIKNSGAIGLYEKAGYICVDQSNPIFQNFTMSLNLHDGATKGRKHFLLCKHFKTPTWTLAADEEPVKAPMGIQVPC